MIKKSVSVGNIFLQSLLTSPLGINVVLSFPKCNISVFMSDNEGELVSQQDDEKKNKKKQSPVDERPTVPAPSEAMLNSKFTLYIYTFF